MYMLFLFGQIHIHISHVLKGKHVHVCVVSETSFVSALSLKYMMSAWFRFLCVNIYISVEVQLPVSPKGNDRESHTHFSTAPHHTTPWDIAPRDRVGKKTYRSSCNLKRCVFLDSFQVYILNCVTLIIYTESESCACGAPVNLQTEILKSKYSVYIYVLSHLSII